MKRNIRAVAICVAIAAPTAGWAQSIEDALASAYRTNSTLEAARAELRAANERVPEAFGRFLPDLSFNADGGFERSLTDTSSASETRSYRRPYGYDLTLEQPIFEGGGNFSRLSSAEANVLAERADLADTEQEILKEAAEAFVDVAQAQSIVRLRENNVAVLERQLQATQDRFSVGEETRTDVAQAEARLAESRAELVEALGEVESATAEYVQIVGELPGEVTPPPAPEGLPATLEQAAARARESNPEVLQAIHLERAAQADVGTARADVLPQLSVRGQFADDFNVTATLDRSQSALVQGRLTIPLYASGEEYAQIRRAKQTASQRRSQRTDEERSAVAEATEAWADLNAAEAQITSFQAAIDATEIALEGVRQESLVGSRTVLDVLDAEQEALDAKVNLVGALRNRVVAAYELMEAVGGLTPQALGLNVQVYDETAHYDEVRYKIFGFGD